MRRLTHASPKIKTKKKWEKAELEKGSEMPAAPVDPCESKNQNEKNARRPSGKRLYLFWCCSAKIVEYMDVNTTRLADILRKDPRQRNDKDIYS